MRAIRSNVLSFDPTRAARRNRAPADNIL